MKNRTQLYIKETTLDWNALGLFLVFLGVFAVGVVGMTMQINTMEANPSYALDLSFISFSINTLFGGAFILVMLCYLEFFEKQVEVEVYRREVITRK